MVKLVLTEGGMLIGGAAFSEESRLRTGALLNTLWDGEPIRRTRVLTGTAFLPGRPCSAHVMLQRVVADRLLGDADLDGIGLLARTLIVAPESTAGTRMFREPSPECVEVLRAYSDRLQALLEHPPVTAPDTTDVLDPPPLPLSPDARALWVRFYNSTEADLAEAGALHPIRAFGAKLAEHAGRLAAVLAIFADPEAMEVGGEAMACGIVLAQHYASEMLRLQGGAAVAPELRLAARLQAWWQARPDRRCHLAEIYQCGPGSLRDAKTARNIVGILEEHGWVRRLPPAVELGGKPRRNAWELVP